VSGVATLEPRIETALDSLESLYGRLAVARLASFLTCSEFGLSETELLELLMPTSNSAATLTLTSGNFNFSTLCAVRRRMGELHVSRISLFPYFVFWLALFISSYASFSPSVVLVYFYLLFVWLLAAFFLCSFFFHFGCFIRACHFTNM
jgi:hypothetical protein